MKLYEFSNGDTIHKYKKSIVILFKGQRNVLSTGPNNGGFTTDLSAVFNNDANPGSGMGLNFGQILIGSTWIFWQRKT